MVILVITLISYDGSIDVRLGFLDGYTLKECLVAADALTDRALDDMSNDIVETNHNCHYANEIPVFTK